MAETGFSGSYKQLHHRGQEEVSLLSQTQTGPPRCIGGGWGVGSESGLWKAFPHNYHNHPKMLTTSVSPNCQFQLLILPSLNELCPPHAHARGLSASALPSCPVFSVSPSALRSFLFCPPQPVTCAFLSGVQCYTFHYLSPSWPFH